MNFEWLWGVTVFVVVATFTPGPNNVMVTASGANFGYRRSVPHLLGITLGFPVMVVAIGLGLTGVFQTLPWLHAALKYGGAAYLIWLAWRIAHGGRATAAASARPLSFLQAAAFQWMNGKAWMMATGALAAFTTPGGDVLLEVLVIALVFGLVCYPSVSIWTVFGAAIGRWLASERSLRAFNWTMAALLVLSLIPVIWA